jgi:hypothetical protein
MALEPSRQSLIDERVNEAASWAVDLETADAGSTAAVLCESKLKELVEPEKLSEEERSYARERLFKACEAIRSESRPPVPLATTDAEQRELEQQELRATQTTLEAETSKTILSTKLESGLSSIAGEALKNHTPLSYLKQQFASMKSGSKKQSSDDYDPKKAYVFACLCELTYLPFTRFDLMARRRYKVVPSEALGIIKKYKRFLTLEDVFTALTANLDGVAAVELLTTRYFSYLAFDTPGFTVIAVRGTVWSTPDTLLNAKVTQDHAYHSGFYKEASKALPQLKIGIADKLSRFDASKPLYFTGHSLGAALAVILQRRWNSEGQSPHSSHEVMTPYTFALPRLGGAIVANAGTIYSHRIKGDPVEHAPPEQLGYCDYQQHMVFPSEPFIKAEKPWYVPTPLAKAGFCHSMTHYRTIVGKGTGVPWFRPTVYFDAIDATIRDIYRIYGNMSKPI